MVFRTKGFENVIIKMIRFYHASQCYSGSIGLLQLLLPILIAAKYFAIAAEVPDCIHDMIQPRNIVVNHIHYVNDREKKNPLSEWSIKRQRRAAKELYRPIRIHVEYHGLEELLTKEEQEKLKTIVRQTTTKISNILSVIPVKDKLLLRRSPNACNRFWLDGLNAGKCSNVKAYEHESCLDHFQIPEEHLEGLFVWNYTHPEPIQEVMPDGPGIPHADYVLYVRAKSTSACFRGGQNIIAYAAYCQVDQNYRPIAGYTNFCPSFLRNNEDDAKIEVTALHEFFHALGFTSELFNNYKDCSGSETGLHCVKHHKPVRLKQNSYRLVTPRVVEATSKHFNCVFNPSHNEFGPILQTMDGVVKSHWDGAFMQGSLMAPNIGLPELTKLDNITLAAFEDMGWYKVNYAYADNYIWGKDGGCGFATKPSCQENGQYFCKASRGTVGSHPGCHYLHQHKGHCKTDDFLSECTVYHVTTQGSCRDTKNQRHAKQDEKYQPDSRCFLANLTSKIPTEPLDMSGYCYEHQCVNRRLQVRVGMGPWTDCPYDQHIQVVGHVGVLQCPREGVLCVTLPEQPIPTPLPTPPTSVHPSVYFVSKDMDTLCIDVYFPNVNYRWLESLSMLDMFKEEVTSLVTQKVGVSRQRVTNAAVVYKTVVIFRFSLLPAQYPNDGPPTKKAYARLKAYVTSDEFTVALPPGGTRYTATYITQKEGGPEYSPSELASGVKAGIVIGSLITALVIAGLVLYIHRYYSLHSRIRPNHGQSEAAQALAAAQRQAALRDPEGGHWLGNGLSVSTLTTRDIHLNTIDHQDSP